MRIEDVPENEGRLVLATPAWVRWLITTLILMSSYGYVSVMVRTWQETASLDPKLLAFSPLILLFAWILSRPRFWQPWIRCMVDRERLYFPDRKGNFHPVSWDRIGAIHIRQRSRRSKQRSIVVQARLTEDEKKQLVPGLGFIEKVTGPIGDDQEIGIGLHSLIGGLERRVEAMEALRPTRKVA